MHALLAEGEVPIHLRFELLEVRLNRKDNPSESPP